jgi:hypothetical protein
MCWQCLDARTARHAHGSAFRAATVSDDVGRLHSTKHVSYECRFTFVTTYQCGQHLCHSAADAKVTAACTLDIDPVAPVFCLDRGGLANRAFA